MDLESAARESGVVRPEHLAELLRSLKTRNFDWIVCSPSQTEDRLQGDIFLDMPVAVIHRDSHGGIVRFSLLSSLSAELYELAIADKRRIASLTQNGYYFLLMKLTHFLARPESSEIVRV